MTCSMPKRQAALFSLYKHNCADRFLLWSHLLRSFLLLSLFAVHSPRESGVALASSSPAGGCTTPSTVPSLTSSSSAVPLAPTPRLAASTLSSPVWPARTSTRVSSAFPRLPGPCKIAFALPRPTAGRCHTEKIGGEFTSEEFIYRYISPSYVISCFVCNSIT